MKRQVSIPSQYIPVGGKKYQDSINKKYLPYLVRAWELLEQATGYQWRATSHWRDSPSHSQGIALDVAPDIDPTAEHLYSVTHMSDPVLYKREPLIRALQQVHSDSLTNNNFNCPYSIGYFIEPDHIHIHIAAPEEGSDPTHDVIKWGGPKMVYPDTQERCRLPLIGDSGITQE